MKSDHKSRTKDVERVHSLNDAIKLNTNAGQIDANDISDGYHTFGQLYDCRLAFNVALFNEWARDYYKFKKTFENTFDLHPRIKQDLNNNKPEYNVHKSIRHHDGELCFGGGWFIVVAILPRGQISFHYKMEDWDKFKIPETKKALYEFDGHTTEDVINRLINI